MLECEATREAEDIADRRTPVREAIRQMEMEGLLEYAPRFGAVVRTPDKTELKLEPPRYRSFDVTEVVRDWVSGKRSNLGLLVKQFDIWVHWQSTLEVRYEGQPAGKLPRQPTNIKAVHRRGQTFITWTEIDKLITKNPVTWKEFETTFIDASSAPPLPSLSSPPEGAMSCPSWASVSGASGWNVNRWMKRSSSACLTWARRYPLGSLWSIQTSLGSR